MAARLSSGAMYNEFCLLIFFVQRVVCVCVHVCVWRFFSELVVAWARALVWSICERCALADTKHSQSKMNRNTRSRSRERSVTGCRCHRTCAGDGTSAQPAHTEPPAPHEPDVSETREPPAPRRARAPGPQKPHGEARTVASRVTLGNTPPRPKSQIGGLMSPHGPKSPVAELSLV